MRGGWGGGGGGERDLRKGAVVRARGPGGGAVLLSSPVSAPAGSASLHARHAARTRGVGEAPALLLGQHGSRRLKAAEDRPARGKERSAQARGWPRRAGSGAAGSGCRGAGQAGGLPGPEARAFRAPASANGRRPPAGGQWAGALGYKCRRRRALATARCRGQRESGGEC